MKPLKRQDVASQRTVVYPIKGRLALVTGAGGGIGKAVALGLASAGIDLALVDITAERTQETRAQAVSTGIEAHGFGADVGRSSDVEALIKEVTGTVAPIDILVHCAGIYPRSPVLSMSEEEWDRVHGTNLKSAFLLTRAVLPSMVDRDYGRIISFTSDLGSTGIPQGSHYAASKAGLNVFTRSVARELSRAGVTINAIAPGPTDTGMLRGSNTAEYIAKVASESPLGRLGRPEDVVSMVLFLVSEGGDAITGQVLGLHY